MDDLEAIVKAAGWPATLTALSTIAGNQAQWLNTDDEHMTLLATRLLDLAEWVRIHGIDSKLIPDAT